MKALINRNKVGGRLKAPASKSYTIRGLMCAALARGESEIKDPLSSDDTEAAARVLNQVGVSVRPGKDSWPVNGGDFHPPEADLCCGDSAATLRFMTAIGATIPGQCRLTAGPSLAKRPVKPLVQALRQWGVDVSCQGEAAPVVVQGGRLKGGMTELPGNISSQFVSALLLIAPLAAEGATIRLTTPLESKSYVLMTLECLEKFGIKVDASPDLREFKVPKQSYQPARYQVEGDWSSASYFLALGAISGEVTVANLNAKSLQGDRIILDFLRDMGAQVKIDRDTITVSRSGLRAIRADLADCIDLLPTMAVLAAVAEGASELTGIARARLKESNRVTAVKEGLERMGIKVGEERDRLTITGARPGGATIDAKGDHRIAMAFSILGLVSGETIISDAECVAKTFPRFWEVLNSIGGEVKINAE